MVDLLDLGKDGRGCGEHLESRNAFLSEVGPYLRSYCDDADAHCVFLPRDCVPVVQGSTLDDDVWCFGHCFARGEVSGVQALNAPSQSGPRTNHCSVFCGFSRARGMQRHLDGGCRVFHFYRGGATPNKTDL